VAKREQAGAGRLHVVEQDGAREGTPRTPTRSFVCSPEHKLEFDSDPVK
jgi:hypothetical protein